LEQGGHLAIVFHDEHTHRIPASACHGILKSG
jgi:hypothetical protein